MDRVWHYTTGQHFRTILEDGFLRPTEVGIEADERPAVWFSADGFWEPTAAKMWRASEEMVISLDMQGTYERGAGLLRFGLPRTDDRLVSWKRFVKVSGIPRTKAKDLAKAGEKKGAAPSNWYASFEPVPVADCAVDCFNGEAWESVDER